MWDKFRWMCLSTAVGLFISYRLSITIVLHRVMDCGSFLSEWRASSMWDCMWVVEYCCWLLNNRYVFFIINQSEFVTISLLTVYYSYLQWSFESNWGLDGGQQSEKQSLLKRAFSVSPGICKDSNTLCNYSASPEAVHTICHESLEIMVWKKWVAIVGKHARGENQKRLRTLFQVAEFSWG